MKNILFRVLWLISGLLLIALGIYFILDPTFTLLSLAVLIGVSMLISGIVDIVIFAVKRDYIAGAGWILADGIITLLMSLFLLFNSVITASVLPFIFGMWVIFTGVSKLISSFDLKKIGVRGWGWFIFIGLLEIALGFASFVTPVAGIAIGIIVGISLIMQGSVAIIKSIFSGRLFL